MIGIRQNNSPWTWIWNSNLETYTRWTFQYFVFFGRREPVSLILFYPFPIITPQLSHGILWIYTQHSLVFLVGWLKVRDPTKNRRGLKSTITSFWGEFPTTLHVTCKAPSEGITTDMRREPAWDFNRHHENWSHTQTTKTINRWQQKTKGWQSCPCRHPFRRRSHHLLWALGVLGAASWGWRGKRWLANGAPPCKESEIEHQWKHPKTRPSLRLGTQRFGLVVFCEQPPLEDTLTWKQGVGTF